MQQRSYAQCAIDRQTEKEMRQKKTPLINNIQSFDFFWKIFYDCNAHLSWLFHLCLNPTLLIRRWEYYICTNQTKKELMQFVAALTVNVSNINPIHDKRMIGMKWFIRIEMITMVWNAIFHHEKWFRCDCVLVNRLPFYHFRDFEIVLGVSRSTANVSKRKPIDLKCEDS